MRCIFIFMLLGLIGSDCLADTNNVAIIETPQQKQLQDYFKKIRDIPGIRVVGGNFYDFTEIARTFATIRRATSPGVPSHFKRYMIWGRVLSVTEDGVLVFDDFSDAAVFLKNYPKEDIVLDGSTVKTIAVITGRHQYKAVSGAVATVAQMECGRRLEAKDDPKIVTRISAIGERVLVKP